MNFLFNSLCVWNRSLQSMGCCCWSWSWSWSGSWNSSSSLQWRPKETFWACQVAEKWLLIFWVYFQSCSTTFTCSIWPQTHTKDCTKLLPADLSKSFNRFVVVQIYYILRNSTCKSSSPSWYLFVCMLFGTVQKLNHLGDDFAHLFAPSVPDVNSWSMIGPRRQRSDQSRIKKQARIKGNLSVSGSGSGSCFLH